MNWNNRSYFDFGSSICENVWDRQLEWWPQNFYLLLISKPLFPAECDAIEWSPAEWFEYSINEFNQYSNNEKSHPSLFKNIREHSSIFWGRFQSKIYILTFISYSINYGPSDVVQILMVWSSIPKFHPNSMIRYVAGFVSRLVRFLEIGKKYRLK